MTCLFLSVKGYREKKKIYISWLLSKSVQFFLMQAFWEAPWIFGPQLPHLPSTYLPKCVSFLYSKVLYSDTSMMEGICIPSLYFLIHAFPTLKNAIILFLICFISLMWKVISVISVYLLKQSVKLWRLHCRGCFQNCTGSIAQLFKHTCLLPTWSKWFDYLFTEIMPQGADYGFNFIWLMDLDFSCALSNSAYPPTVQLPHWYALFFVSVCLIWRVEMI